MIIIARNIVNESLIGNQKQILSLIDTRINHLCSFLPMQINFNV